MPAKSSSKAKTVLVKPMSSAGTVRKIENPKSKDFLWLHLRDLPYFRAMLRAVEAGFYQDFDLPRPVLDVGCGDGHFASVTFDLPLDVGIDPWGGPIRLAQGYGGYRSLVQADAACSPFPDASFASAISNSVLEHIPHIQAVLDDVARLLEPGSPFLFCVPNDRFLAELSIGRALDRVGLHALGDAYRNFFKRITRHVNSDPPEVWQRRLENAGFKLVRWWHYFSPQATRVLEWGHYFGGPTLVARLLFKRWIIAPTRWNLALTERYVRPYTPVEDNPQGTYTFYVAERI